MAAQERKARDALIRTLNAQATEGRAAGPAPRQGRGSRVGRRSLPRWLGAGLLVLLAGATGAQEAADYPAKPVRLIVPYAAGISPDVVARLLADKLSQAWGRPVLVDNRPGASGIIGAEAAAKSPGDGYTLLMSVTAIMSMNPHLYAKLSYNPLTDFKPVTHVLNVPFVVTGAPSKPYPSMAELLDAARRQPGQIDYASLGAGSHSHVAMEWVLNLAGARMTHVPYKSSPTTDLIGGQVSAYFDPIVTAIPLVRERKVRGLAVTSLQRSPALPEVPALSETLPGFESYAYQGIFVPASTPDAIVNKLNEALVRVIRLPDVQKKLRDFGYTPVGSSVAEFARLVRDDHAQYGRVIRENHIRLD